MDNVVFDSRFHDLVDSREIILVGEGFGLTEGPVMSPEGYLIFSDVVGDTIHQFFRPSRTSVYRTPSGGANGNTLDLQGRLITCETGWRRVTRTEHDGSITVLAESYEGKRLNAPNDVVVASNGSIYFTDPLFLAPNDDFLASSYMALDFCGVFQISPDGDLSLATNDVALCNGLAFSPDESLLYIVNSADNSVYAFDVFGDGTIGNKRLWLEMRHETKGVGDGMKVDVEGNAYVTGPGGVWVVASDGTPLGIIRVPVETTNVAFYGFDSKILFITARTDNYMAHLKIPGISVIDRIR